MKTPRAIAFGGGQVYVLGRAGVDDGNAGLIRIPIQLVQKDKRTKAERHAKGTPTTPIYLPRKRKSKAASLVAAVLAVGGIIMLGVGVFGQGEYSVGMKCLTFIAFFVSWFIWFVNSGALD